MKRKFL